VLRAGGDPARVVFSGVGKTPDEIELALRNGIDNFNCESEGELAGIDAIAGALGVTARFSLARESGRERGHAHPYISTGLRDHKFGIDIAQARAVYARRRGGFPESARGGRQLPYRLADSRLRPDTRSRRQSAGAHRTTAAPTACRSFTLISAAASVSPTRRRIALPTFRASSRLCGRDRRAGLKVMIEPGLHRGAGGRSADARSLSQEEPVEGNS